MEAVVFDMDGVIFDSERIIMECWKEVADKYAIPNIEEACLLCLGVNAVKTKEIMQQKYGDNFPYEEYKKEASALFHKRCKERGLPKKDGAEELLCYLQKKQIKVALASSTRRQVVLKELEDARLLHYFNQIVCGDMVKRSKPEPDIFLKACEELQVIPKNAYAIEDSYNGIRAAYLAGMKPIMVPDLAKPTAEMEQITECILPSLFEVKKYFQQLR